MPQPMDIVIRPVRKEDLPLLVEIDEVSTGENRERYLERKLEEALDKKWRLVASNVIEIEGKVVGFLMAEVITGEFGLPENVARIDTIGLLPEYRGKALATDLFKHTINQLKKLGVNNVRTLVDWHDQDLIKFFASKGFVPGNMLSLEVKI
ncbi:MAG: GNAT family N-acetyltransferase [Candidatus Electryonea clarkiae]|nr:GNAT family N-acetyltransferase [Candidatus Electryonea clarkiae]MDP8287605.1 GNAT family N-acetyltransferase [Candidatus Electryonea clarkiae]